MRQVDIYFSGMVNQGNFDKLWVCKQNKFQKLRVNPGECKIAFLLFSIGEIKLSYVHRFNTKAKLISIKYI